MGERDDREAQRAPQGFDFLCDEEARSTQRWRTGWAEEIKEV